MKDGAMLADATRCMLSKSMNAEPMMAENANSDCSNYR
jgi:hypothetical protein